MVSLLYLQAASSALEFLGPLPSHASLSSSIQGSPCGMICKMAAVPWVRRMSCSAAAAGFRRKAKVAEIKKGPVGETVTVRGWVRTLRRQANLGFVEVNDGSCLSNLQCVVGPDTEGYEEYVASNTAATGASVQVDGELVASPGSKQSVEVKARKICVIGGTDPSFPIQKKNVSSEFLRTKAHLRPRTNKFGAVARVRSDMELATHLFCKTQGAVSVRTPIITTSDCEGAGELFRLAGDFFDQTAFLTVSGQLNAEAYASALSDVYTFGPTFRAENSNTSRHLAEFWMLEAELAFADLDEDIAYATAYLKYVVKYILENCQEDMEFFNTWIEKGITDRLTEVVEKQFVEMTYTEAIDLLLKSKQKFEFPVVWGSDLQSEHERYITEVAFNGCPVIVRDYPKEVKAFYMRQNDDGKTVAAMDFLVPKVGELIGGSQREERLEHLEKRIDELKLNKEGLWWYLDLRRYGSVPHAGFGLGFERFVQFVTGVDNIKDTIPFPRTPGSADF